MAWSSGKLLWVSKSITSGEPSGSIPSQDTLFSTIPNQRRSESNSSNAAASLFPCWLSTIDDMTSRRFTSSVDMSSVGSWWMLSVSRRTSPITHAPESAPTTWLGVSRLWGLKLEVPRTLTRPRNLPHPVGAQSSGTRSRCLHANQR